MMEPTISEPLGPQPMSLSSTAEATTMPRTQRYEVKILMGVAEAMSHVIHQDIEIIVHDLLHPEHSIVQITHGHVSHRQVGDSIVSGLLDDRAFDMAVQEMTPGEPNAIRVVGGYVTRTRDGRRLQSSSLILFDLAGRPSAALCINGDPTAMEQIQAAVNSLMGVTAAIPPPQLPKSNANIGDLVTEIIETALGAFGSPADRLSRKEKVAAVAAMHERGLFLLSGAAQQVADAMGTTRFSIYNYLRDIGESRGQL